MTSPTTICTLRLTAPKMHSQGSFQGHTSKEGINHPINTRQPSHYPTREEPHPCVGRMTVNVSLDHSLNILHCMDVGVDAFEWMGSVLLSHATHTLSWSCMQSFVFMRAMWLAHLALCAVHMRCPSVQACPVHQFSMSLEVRPHKMKQLTKKSHEGEELNPSTLLERRCVI